MGKKLYVGNLPYSTTDEILREIFEQIGQVTSANVIIDRESGRSKGFGFVEMGTDELAAEAISRFHGADFSGRAMTVAEARPPQQGGGGGGRGFGGGGGGGGGRGDRGGYGGGRRG